MPSNFGFLADDEDDDGSLPQGLTLEAAEILPQVEEPGWEGYAEALSQFGTGVTDVSLRSLRLRLWHLMNHQRREHPPKYKIDHEAETKANGGKDYSVGDWADKVRSGNVKRRLIPAPPPRPLSVGQQQIFEKNLSELLPLIGATPALPSWVRAEALRELARFDEAVAALDPRTLTGPEAQVVELILKAAQRRDARPVYVSAGGRPQGHDA